jgi:hypothetical protein
MILLAESLGVPSVIATSNARHLAPFASAMAWTLIT